MPTDFPMANEPLILRFTDQPISPEQLLEKLTKGESWEEHISTDEKKEWTSLEDKFGKGNLINYLFPEKMDKETRRAFMAGYPSPYNNIDRAITDVASFKKKSDIIEWLRQKYLLDERKLRYLRCIKVKYPKPEKEPQYKILDPQGAKDFPGIPIDQMQLPAPTARSVPRPPPEETIIKLMFSFGVIIWSSISGYQLILNLEEVKG